MISPEYCHADAVKDKPCALLRDAKCPVNLVTADSVLCVRYQPDRRQQLIQAERRILEDRADLDAELFFASVASLHFPHRNEVKVKSLAAQANHAIRPGKFHDENPAGGSE